MTKYLIVHSLGKWADAEGAQHEHWIEAIVKPFEGKRPRGRVYEAEVYMVVDRIISEHNKPTCFYTNAASTQWLMGSVPEDWLETTI